ncbi:transposase [Thermodesulfovibrio sp.]|uniref:IS1634 family transposase n=1 Tax=Thermodesulfovibrio sp. TaxID=2067987 RepID=UPI00260F50A1|nr:transposase [Thermodesulfovibrio sp.]
MSYIRYKTFGNRKYAYEVTSFWDSKQQKPRQKVKYLGRVDEQGNIIEKRIPQQKEKLILDFGDTYLLYEFIKKTELIEIINSIFGEYSKELLSLICYRISNPSAMNYAKIWYEGNIARFLFDGANLSSQRISKLLEKIGDEKLQRDFFIRYLSCIKGNRKGVIIDTTALPNQIGLSFNAWGYNDGEIDQQIRFLFVIDRETSYPLFFRYLPGNIVDVSSLRVTIEELTKAGIRDNFVLIDAGFFSEENIRELNEKGIEFLTRLPSSRILYKELIKEEAGALEKFEHAVKYGKRVLFVKRKEVELYGKNVYSYLVLDPERKGREMKKLLISALDGEEEEIEYKLLKQGIMILISSFPIDTKEVVSCYYLRQRAEMLFGFFKDDLKLIPLRVHKEETLRGYLFLIFIVLTVFVRLKGAIGRDYTVEEILFVMRNLKCKVYENEIIVQELTKQQREILDTLNIIVPKKSGI